jgi:hypothetical protein
MKDRKYDLQDRMIDFAVRIVKLAEALPETKAGQHVGFQIKETDELISILFKSVETAKENDSKGK